MGKFNKELIKGMIAGATLATMITSGISIAVASSTYGDVPSGKWYTDAVMWAKQEGIMKGVSEDKFAPDEYMTRAQFAQAMKNLQEQGYLVKSSTTTNPTAPSQNTSNNTTPTTSTEGTTGNVTPTTPAEETTGNTTPVTPVEGNTSTTTPTVPTEGTTANTNTTTPTTPAQGNSSETTTTPAQG
ncbi:S-layer homology domain-containing protein [Heliobacterium chlorum]|uniref:S-layer homology domain-containing protein n=1 Tax=Heliobacterium chlorum TaxID=2698 RepID=A0ABR7SZC6_HELCL|nr:S-layer homology domain-containing protein [Heliobacterium chlorum]MBC9783055.1 S-layer homology domain-containing protein [Heliobacterium chlorum]